MNTLGKAALRAHIDAHCEEVGDCILCSIRAIRVARPTGEGDTAMNLRRAYWLTTKELPQGWCVSNTCRTPNCVAHLTAMPKSKLSSRKHTAPVSLATRLKIAANKPKKFSDEAIAEMQTSTEPVSALAKRLGMSKAYGYMVRRGEFRCTQNAGVWSGLMGVAC